MKGVCCSLPIQLIGVNKFQTLSAMHESALISLKYRDNKIYWCVIENEEPIFMSSSEIKDIKISDDYTDLMIIGYRAKEIAKNINVGKFIERNHISIQDFLEYSRKIIIPKKFLPKPLYISPGQSLFCLLYTSPSPRDGLLSRMPSSA